MAPGVASGRRYQGQARSARRRRRPLTLPPARKAWQLSPESQAFRQARRPRFWFPHSQRAAVGRRVLWPCPRHQAGRGDRARSRPRGASGDVSAQRYPVIPSWRPTTQSVGCAPWARVEARTSPWSLPTYPMPSW